MHTDQDYTFSLNEAGVLIDVRDAVKGNVYFCPCCGAVMLPRQGNVRRWHFAHKSNAVNCSYETYLHKIAKQSIRECFEKSSNFFIEFLANVSCSVEECPLGNNNPCTWKQEKVFDLKKYYDCCSEEAAFDSFRADILLINSKRYDFKPVAIEIFVSHRSSTEKLESNHKIIEIKIDSEDDIRAIISASKIIESEKVSFYNFNADTCELPDANHQAVKHMFWIRSNGNFLSVDNYYGSTLKCLTPIPIEVESSIFHIESTDSIEWDFAFNRMVRYGLNIAYCSMCRFYKFNDYHMRMLCVLYKLKNTPQFPEQKEANNCPYFKERNLAIEGLNPEQRYRITINGQSYVCGNDID
ncbi:MAG: hypothetical protein HDS78_00675 [Bacteroidales bacterium]|nr:hypothetical protein [Bacteroidales bacterium]